MTPTQKLRRTTIVVLVCVPISWLGLAAAIATGTADTTNYVLAAGATACGIGTYLMYRDARRNP